MAKSSSIEKNKRRRRVVENKKATRDVLKTIVMNRETSFEERIVAVHKLAQMSRDASKTRIRNRCEVTGRPRGYYRKFGMSRISLRDLGSKGMIPGLVKASW